MLFFPSQIFIGKACISFLDARWQIRSSFALSRGGAIAFRGDLCVHPCLRVSQGLEWPAATCDFMAIGSDFCVEQR